MASSDRLPAVPSLLLVTLAGVYALVMLGATTSVTDALASCGGWPACDGRVLVAPSDPAAVALAHRLVAVVVGLLLLVVLIAAVRQREPRRVRIALGCVAIGYLAQIGVGAMTALELAGPLVGTAHLGLGMGIFAALVAAFAWSLERRHPTIRSPARESASPTEPQPALDREPTWRDVAAAYLSLTKPRLMWLLCLVALAAMAFAAGPALPAGTVLATLLGGVLAIGASGTFNHVLERDVDRRMQRTSDRPLAADLIPVRRALAFGVVLGALSIGIFLAFVNVLAAALGLAAIVFYSVIYTLILKPNTVQNTVVGGFAGALPALIGWAAITGSLSLAAFVLALVIFAWTPAHFYNLALIFKRDYARGGFPMLPVVRGDRETRKHIVWYAGATMLAVAWLAAIEPLGWLFAAVAIATGLAFVVMIHRLHVHQTRTAAWRTFHASNGYLGLLLVAIIVDALLV